MRWFLDTEYVSSDTWVSAALVSECGTQVLYAENQDLDSVSDFVRANVLPGLWGVPWRHCQSDWVALLAKTVASDDEVLSDHPGDRAHWERWRQCCDTSLPAWGLMDLWDSQAAYWRGRDAWWQAHPEAPRHHALSDAWSLQHGWRARGKRAVVLMDGGPFLRSSPWSSGMGWALKSETPGEAMPDPGL